LKEIKTPYVGLLGTSVGATYAAVAANTFSKLNSVFFIVGGVTIPRVVVTSDHPNMVKFRKERYEKFKFKNDAAYEAAIDQVFHLEPTRLGDVHVGKDFGAVISTNDSTVPFATQQNLVGFFHPRTVIELSSSHFWAILKTWLFHSHEIQDFFEQSVSKASARP
jgi:hypothetical protein